MAPRLSSLVPRAVLAFSALLALFAGLSAAAPALAAGAATASASPAPAAPPAPSLEATAAAAARAGRWEEVLGALVSLQKSDPGRYAAGRFDYLAARALASTGRSDEALPRFEAFIATGDIFDVPARLSAARIRFARGEGSAALDLLLPLLERKEGAVSRRALRFALDALETDLDPGVLARLALARPQSAPRERRRMQALQAEALEKAGKAAEAADLRRAILEEARRDDAAAIVLARELRGTTPATLPDDRLTLLIEAARSQRDLDLAERLAAERSRRLDAGPDALAAVAARFDLSRIRASRGRFAEAADGYRALLASLEAPGAAAAGLTRPPRSRKDDAPGTPGFASRIRFNLGAVLEKLADLDGAARELARVERDGVGPAALATLQRARLEIRRGRLDDAEKLLSLESVAKEPGRIEGTFLLVLRRAEAGDGPGAARALARIEGLARSRRLPEPWKSELGFWQGRAAEARGPHGRTAAAAAYARVLSTSPGSIAGQLSEARLRGLPAPARDPLLARMVAEGKAFLAKGQAAKAKERLLPAATLGDAGAREALLAAYRALPTYAAILLVPEYPDDLLATLCGDLGACRLLQLGLPGEAEPVVRDARRLDSLHGAIVAARLAENADAGPAALEAAEALDRRVPDDFLPALTPPSVRRALAPRPFWRLVATTAAETGVPEDLLYAVMRQESRFDHEAVSPAAARGLMQLTLPAAGDAARQLHEEPPAYAELYDPARSIRLGAITLRALLDRFAGDGPSAVSGYNAGAGQTSLWRGEAASPAEALLGSISYTETRTYFRRVLFNRLLYKVSAR